MSSKRCFEKGCKFRVQYACINTSPETYSCEFHLEKHYKLMNRYDAIDAISVEPFSETKDAIISLLVKENSKKETLKKKILGIASKNLLSAENSLRESLSRLDSDTLEMSSWIDKISATQKISKWEQDPILKLLFLQPEDAVKSIKEMIPKNSYENEKLFCFLNVEIERMVESLIKNTFETTLNERLSHFKSRLEDIDKKIGGNLAEMNQPISISQEIYEKKINFEDLKKEINIEMILEDQDKRINNKINEVDRFISHMIDERDKNIMQKIEDLKQEISIKSINGKLNWMNLSISHMIEEREKNIKQKMKDFQKELNIEKRFEEYDKKIKSKLTEIIEENEKTQIKIENLRKEINAKMKLEEKDKSIYGKLNWINLSISLMIEEREKNIKKKFEDFRQEVNNKSLKGFDIWKGKTIYNKKESNSLDSQISSITKEQEIVQNQNINNIMTIQNLSEKRSELLNSSNSLELEEEFRKICSLYESHSNAHDASIMHAYQDYVSAYHQKTSLFNLIYDNDSRTNLLIYNTETETQDLKILDSPQPLNWGTCITQLPNGKLFCFGNISVSGIALLIDENYRVQELPSGTACGYSSAIYFNNNIYCFGGWKENNLTLSSRFDLDKNQWNELTSLPKADAGCNSIIFGRSILIAGVINKNLLRYSIDENSFTTIPYNFAEKKRKILMNAERLYLIECDNGSIYESEIGSDTAWRKITNNSVIDFNLDQIYCAYNKEGIYIGSRYYKDGDRYACYMFKLNEKTLTKLFDDEL